MALAGALMSVKVVVPFGSVESQTPLRRIMRPSKFQFRVTVAPSRTAVHASSIGGSNGVAIPVPP